MKRWLILFTVGCVAFAGVANAAVQQGDTEIDVLGSWFTQNGEEGIPDLDVLFVSARLGYFISDNIQVAGVGLGAWTDLFGTDVDIYAIGASAKYHFMPTNQMVPYIGGQILWGDIDTDAGDDDATLWGPVAGLRYELNAYNDFFVEYQYHVWDGDISDILDGGHAVFIGLIHQFK
ncbi:MAG: outer membrane beta-barrel protein [Phycisphaerales bacterium]|nr:MAG: outer membrane beta-barrel protein [Phycisphaerales bacterium]